MFLCTLQIFTTFSINYYIHITVLLCGQLQQTGSLLVLSIEISRYFVPIFDRNNKSPQVCLNFNNNAKCRAFPCPFSHICQSCQESNLVKIRFYPLCQIATQGSNETQYKGLNLVTSLSCMITMLCRGVSCLLID